MHIERFLYRICEGTIQIKIFLGAGLCPGSYSKKEKCNINYHMSYFHQHRYKNMEKEKHPEFSPIKDKRKIQEIAAYLYHKNPKYYIMFLLGIQSGIFVNDVLQFRVSDIKHLECKQEHHILKRRASLDKEVLAVIWRYVEEYHLSDDDYLIPSQKKDQNGNSRPIGRTMAFKVLQDAGAANGIEHLSPQTMRRTYGYHYYEQTKDINGLMDFFGSNSLKNTLKFIGVSEEEYRSQHQHVPTLKCQFFSDKKDSSPYTK